MSLRIIDGLNIQLFDTITAVTFGMQPAALLDAQGNSLISNSPAAPQVISPIADLVQVVGASPITIDLATRFSGATHYAISPTNMTGVTLAGAILTVNPTAAAARRTVTVTGINPAGASASLTFALTITAPMPTVTAPLPDQSLRVGDSNVTIDLSLHFANAVTYAVSPANQGVTIDGTVLTISTAAARNASYTVTATDIAGQSVTDAFNLEVVLATFAPAIVTQPSIRGGPLVGSVLSATPGTAAGNPTPKLARRWLSDGVLIAGATKSTFDTTGRAGQAISLQVTWSNGVGSPAVATSPALMITAATAAPTLGTEGMIAIDGDDIVLTAPLLVTAGHPAPTVTLTATRNGSPITVIDGRFVGGAIPGDTEQVYAARWTAANGTLPDAVQEAVLTIKAWAVKPLDGGLLDLTKPVFSTTADAWPQMSVAPLVLNTGSNVSSRRGGWSFQSIKGAKYLAQIKFGTPFPNFTSGAAVRAARTAAFDFDGPNLIAGSAITNPPNAEGVHSVAFTGTGDLIWVGVALGFTVAEANKPLPIMMLRVDRTDTPDPIPDPTHSPESAEKPMNYSMTADGFVAVPV